MTEHPPIDIIDADGFPQGGNWVAAGQPCPTCGRRPRLSGWSALHGGEPYDELVEVQRAFDHAVERLIEAAENWQWCEKAPLDEGREPIPEELDALQELSDAATLVAVINALVDDLEDQEDEIGPPRGESSC